MIEIKQSRKLHSSGYRTMQITDGKSGDIINSAADVLHIGIGNWLYGLHLDITKQGIIRIWSNNYDLEPLRQYNNSDSIFMLKEKNYEL